ERKAAGLTGLPIVPAAAVMPPEPPRPRGVWSRLLGTREEQPPVEPDRTRAMEADIALVEDRLRMLVAEMEQAGRPPARLALAETFELVPFERDVLLLCAAAELNTSVGPLCARAMDDPHRPYPTFALALTLFDGPDWLALTPDRPLRRLSLIELQQP